MQYQNCPNMRALGPQKFQKKSDPWFCLTFSRVTLPKKISYNGIFRCCWLLKMLCLENLIHLTGAGTNPWMRFQSDDSFIKFDNWTNLFNLVQFYSAFLLHILHFLTLSIFSGQTLFDLLLHLQYSTFNSKLQLHFNLKL